MFSPHEMSSTLQDLGITHVIWVPDSTFGLWEAAFESAGTMRLLRVCREGEAWPLAAGLQIGGQSPLVMMQSTGFFESGDALRNVVFDLRVPVFAIVGARNWLVKDSLDSARRFALPLLEAWGLDYVMVEESAQKERLGEHYQHCRRTGTAGAVVLAEGPG